MSKGRWNMKVAVGVIDAVLGTVTLTPRGLEIEGPEREILGRLVRDFRSASRDDEEVLRRMLDRLQGYTWATEVNEGGPGRAAGPADRPETPRAAASDPEAGAAGGVTLAPIEIDDSWLDAAG
jgi:hypothetical protein